MKDVTIAELINERKYKLAAKHLYAYFPAVLKFVRGAGGSKQEAEDVFQDGLLIFFRKVDDGSFEQRSSAQTFLYSICKHLWLDELRRKKRESNLQSFTETEETAFSNDEYNRFRMAEQAFQLLGEKCKALLQLFYFKRESLSNIAKRLGFSSDKVAKNKKYRCLEKAKEHLKTIQSNSHE